MTGQFPQTRLRRNRQNAWSRELMAEVKLTASDLIWPVFVQESPAETAIESLPHVSRYDINMLCKKAQEAYELGIPAIALFPYIAADKKTDDGEEAWNHENLVCRAVAKLKERVPEIGIICDVALDPYRNDGQDGVVVDGIVHNDMTVDCLLRQALTLAEAGADYVAPSDMMDGRIGAIRTHLDNESYTNVGIISYAAKYASHFYGPFRDAVGSKSALGSADKRSYQMDYRNSDVAMREVDLDIREGADVVMVKPAMSYLDIVQRVRDRFDVPVMAYHVSGEYAAIHAAAQNGWLDANAALIEQLTACKRAGACATWTYAALDIAKHLKERS